jgi:hypothetical protein
MEIKMSTASMRVYDVTNLSVAKAVLDKLAQTMSPSARSDQTRIVRYGPIQKVGLPNLAETSIFTGIYTFNGTSKDLAALISASQSCRHLDSKDGCTACRKRTGWDLCKVFQSLAPSSLLYDLATSSLGSSPVGRKPSKVSLSWPARITTSR